MVKADLQAQKGGSGPGVTIDVDYAIFQRTSSALYLIPNPPSSRYVVHDKVASADDLAWLFREAGLVKESDELYKQVQLLQSVGDSKVSLSIGLEIS